MDEWNGVPFDWEAAVASRPPSLEEEEFGADPRYDPSSPPEDPRPALPCQPAKPGPPAENQDPLSLKTASTRCPLNPDMPKLKLQKKMVRVPGKKFYNLQYSIDYSKKVEKVVAKKKKEVKEVSCQLTVPIPWEGSSGRQKGLSKLPRPEEFPDLGPYQPRFQPQPFYSNLHGPGQFWHPRDYHFTTNHNPYETSALMTPFPPPPFYGADYFPGAGYFPEAGYPNFYEHDIQNRSNWGQETVQIIELGKITSELPVLTDLSGLLSPTPEEFHQPLQYAQLADYLDPAPSKPVDYPAMAVQDQVIDGGISLGLTSETPYQPAAQNSPAPISPQFDSSNLPLHQMDYPGRPLSLPGHLTAVNSPEGRPPLSLPTFSGLQPENHTNLSSSLLPMQTSGTLMAAAASTISTLQTTPSVPEIVENIYKSAAQYKDTGDVQKNQKKRIQKRSRDDQNKRDVPQFKNRDQKAYLEYYFERNSRPTTLDLEMICSTLNLSLKQVRNWFYNKRAKISKETLLRPGRKGLPAQLYPASFKL